MQEIGELVVTYNSLASDALSISVPSADIFSSFGPYINRDRVRFSTRTHSILAQPLKMHYYLACICGMETIRKNPPKFFLAHPISSCYCPIPRQNRRPRKIRPPQLRCAKGNLLGRPHRSRSIRSFNKQRSEIPP